MATALPEVSLVVNTLNRAGPLATLLRSLERQSYPRFEVVVVVGPCSDGTLDVLARYDGRLRVLRCPDAVLGHSRNIGIRAACGDIIAFVDDDCVPCERWVEQIVRFLYSGGMDATGGTVYLAHPKHPMTQLRFGLASSLMSQLDVRSSALDRFEGLGQGAWWTPRPMGTNMAFRRKPLLAVGGFDEFYNAVADETDLAIRLTRAGGIVRPVRDAVVYHVPASSHTREVFTYRGTWWHLATRAYAYYCARNGPPSGDRWLSIARRWGALVYGHWLTYGQLWRAHHLSAAEALSMGAGDLAGLASGVWHGVTGERRLIPAAEAKAVVSTEEPILPFQTEDSPYHPAVDPVSGRQSRIKLVDPPLRICLLSKAYPPAEIDGVGRHTHTLAQGLFELGHSVHVIAGGDREEVSFYDGAYVHRIPYALDRYEAWRGFTHLFHALNRSHAVFEQVRRLMVNDGVQVVDTPLWGTEGLVTRMDGSIPVVARLETARRQIASLQGEQSDDARLIGEIERELVQRADHLVPNSQAIVKGAREIYGIDLLPERFTVIPHGIVPVGNEDVRPMDADHPPSEPTVLFVGRLEKRKGVGELFAAIPRVLREHPRARFIFAGADNSRHDGFQNQKGTDYPDYFVAHYAKFAGSVTFLGHVSDDRLRDLYRSCDLFVAPSLYESFGLIYVEAMNFGKPVIGCRAGGIPEVIDDGVTGLLVEPGEPSQLARAISALLASPGRMRAMGLAGRQQVVSRFDYLIMARAFADVYRKVIAAAAERNPSATC